MGPSVRRLYQQGKSVNGAGINASIAVHQVTIHRLPLFLFFGQSQPAPHLPSAMGMFSPYRPAALKCAFVDVVQDATGNAADIAAAWAIGCGAPFAFGGFLLLLVFSGLTCAYYVLLHPSCCFGNV